MAAVGAVTVTLAGCGAAASSGSSGTTTTESSVPGGSSPNATSSSSGDDSATTETPASLPRGGRTVFPEYRVVAYYGTAGTSGLGVLGSKPPDQVAPRIEKQAAGFATPGRKVQPAMELIVTVADRTPGPSGHYYHAIEMAKVQQYLKAARKHHMLLVLDIQPGSADYLPLVKKYKEVLAEPEVGLALDSEWHMPDGSIPGHVIGHSSASDINEVTSWLSDFTKRHRLPEKLVVLHQFTAPMIQDIADVKHRPGLAMVQHLDGFGSRDAKLAKYRNLKRPKQFHMGFKLFYTQDNDLMPPKRVLRLKPPPEYVSYQ